MVNNNTRKYIKNLLINTTLYGMSAFVILKIYTIVFKHVDFTMKYYILGFIGTMTFSLIETFTRNKYIECYYKIDSNNIQNEVVKAVSRHVKLDNERLISGTWNLSKLKYPQDLQIQIIINQECLTVIGPKSVMDVINFELRNI